MFTNFFGAFSVSLHINQIYDHHAVHSQFHTLNITEKHTRMESRNIISLIEFHTTLHVFQFPARISNGKQLHKEGYRNSRVNIFDPLTLV